MIFKFVLGGKFKMSEKEFSKTIFLSYSWHDSKLADSIDESLKAEGFIIKRDIRDIGAWKSLKEFMSSIRNYRYAIIIISSNYLKSVNCMYEVTELLKDEQYNKDKIFSIVTLDADIYNSISKVNYINYWHNKTKELEDVLKPLDIADIPELAFELRKHKYIEMAMAPFLDFISDRNNPQIVNAVEQIIETVKNNIEVSITEQIEEAEIEINVEACHYARLKFAALSNSHNAELDDMIGIKKLNSKAEQDEYDLPMLKCEVINKSKLMRIIDEPMITGSIALRDDTATAISFALKNIDEKRLKPYAKATFILNGQIMIGIIKSLFENKIKSISVKDNFDFKYYVPKEQLVEMKNYFEKYCYDLEELEKKFELYS